MSLTAQELVKLDPTNIQVRRSTTDRDYLVFFKTQTIARLLISDVLGAAVGNPEWIKKVCLAKVIDINDVDECGGETLLYRALSNASLHSTIPLLCSQQARVTATELIELHKNGTELETRSSAIDKDMLVISIKINNTQHEIIRLKARELFEAAINARDATLIERLIASKLIPDPTSPNVPTPNPHPHFEHGCWVTRVSDVEREIKRIKAFEGGYKFNATHATPYSSATFIQPNLGVKLFKEDNPSKKAGLLIKRANRTVSYWYSGLLGEELTDGRSLTQLQKQANEAKDDHHFTNVPEAKLLATLDSCVDAFWKGQGRRFDKYGVIKRNLILNWNEGFIFYKSNEVFGIQYDPNSVSSTNEAVALYKAFKENFNNQKLPFYSYKNGWLEPEDAPKEILQLQQTYTTIYKGLFFDPKTVAPKYSKKYTKNSGAISTAAMNNTAAAPAPSTTHANKNTPH